MLLKKKMTNIIQCPSCEWRPDGNEHWICSCGHRWNTFETKAKCPKCHKQWENTSCPACGESTAHKDWYKSEDETQEKKTMVEPELEAKKIRLQSRLIDYGIKDRKITYLPYLDHTKEEFQSTYDAGCRMMILYALSLSVYELDVRLNIAQWFKDEGIWSKVSPLEKEYLINSNPDEDTLNEFSWRIESAMTLAWSLNLIEELPRLDKEDNEKEIEEFLSKIPEVGAPISSFLSDLEYRDLAEIYEENLLNELATSYFRDLLFNGKEDLTSIDRGVSFERHKVLNWLRKFGFVDFEDNKEENIGEFWDNVDTAT